MEGQKLIHPLQETGGNRRNLATLRPGYVSGCRTPCGSFLSIMADGCSKAIVLSGRP